MKKPTGRPGKHSEPKGKKKNQKRTSQIPPKNKSNVVKYGSLSRKQKDHLHEYGELDPAGQEVENDAEELNNDLSEFIAKKRRRIVTEKELEAEEPVEQDEDVQQPYGANETESWYKPSAYGKLVKLLQKNSSNKAFYERRKIEEEGLEDLDEDEEEEEEVDDEKVLELTEEEAKLYREKYGDDAVVDLDNENDKENEPSEDNDGEEDEESDDEEEAKIEEDETYDSDQSDDENVANTKDEFEVHFGDKNAIALTEQANLVDQRQWKTTSFEDNAMQTVILNECGPSTDSAEEKKRRLLLEKADLDQWKIKKRMHETWQKVNSACIGKGSSRPFTSLQTSLLSHINKYRDLLFSDRHNENSSAIMNTYCLHALNHVLKTRDRVLKNTAKIAQLQSQDKDVSEIRDQGFTRPKVLILVPFRNSAKKVVETLIRLSGSEQVEKRKRFYDEFSTEEKEEEEEGNDPSKPADYNATFSGNVDDHFRVGIKFTRKTIKLYSDFYASDVLVASPLGLRMIIGAEGDKKRDYDFLSSIELVVLDQCDTFLMQNWDHMESVFSHLNLIPKQAHDCDFSRVRNWYLDGKARYLRQTLIFSQYLTPEINSLYNSEMKNLAGKVKSKRTYEGSIVEVLPQVKQVFTRLECPSFSEVDNLRFQHFTGKTLAALRHSSVSQSHTCIVIPSYFDFVRVRNYFMENEINFGQLSEYTTRADISRARSDFFHGRRPFLLVTERFHFFRRYRLRGIRRLIFYAPPDHPQFYSEFVNFLALPAVATSRKGGQATNEDFSDANAVGGVVGTLYSKFDQLRMERIVGTSRVSKMCKGDKGVYLFA